MTSSVSSPPVPSEHDDEVDDDYLPDGHTWAYPCRLPSCPDYAKAHKMSPTTPGARRAIEIDWRYTTDPRLPPRAAPDFRSREDADEHVWDYSFKDGNGKLVSGTGTMKQMEMHKASLRRQAEKKGAALRGT
ncbi:hypothetical protein BJ875DRAFT_508229 [Amylocarpus encephaloides]|uniref:Uncharacterized protein n=1 Tax=Amylocarpus encephaloides TaxID=45428 RepID=A0A9P8C012_9HELO|nr:hypothetical protein BJ875DRAFT_508229 [Amylocarpus encephaloides]